MIANQWNSQFISNLQLLIKHFVHRHERPRITGRQFPAIYCAMATGWVAEMKVSASPSNSSANWTLQEAGIFYTWLSTTSILTPLLVSNCGARVLRNTSIELYYYWIYILLFSTKYVTNVETRIRCGVRYCRMRGKNIKVIHEYSHWVLTALHSNWQP